jgi:hypothetical protein
MLAFFQLKINFKFFSVGENVSQKGGKHIHQYSGTRKTK